MCLAERFWFGLFVCWFGWVCCDCLCMLWGLVFVWILVCGLVVIVDWCLLDLFGWLRLDGDLVYLLGVG